MFWRSSQSLQTKATADLQGNIKPKSSVMSPFRLPSDVTPKAGTEPRSESSLLFAKNIPGNRERLLKPVIFQCGTSDSKSDLISDAATPPKHLPKKLCEWLRPSQCWIWHKYLNNILLCLAVFSLERRIWKVPESLRCFSIECRRDNGAVVRNCRELWWFWKSCQE